MAVVSAISRKALCTSVSIDGATWARKAMPRGPLQQRRARELGAGRRAGRALERGQQLVAQRIGRAVVAQRAAQRQHQLLFHPSAPHGQVAVRGGRLQQLAHRLLVGEVVLEAAGGLGLLSLARSHAAALEQRRAHLLAKPDVLRQPFDQDVRRAGQGGGRVGDPLAGVDEAGRARLGRLGAGQAIDDISPCAAAPQPVGQRLQASLARGLGLGLSFLLVRKVEVLEQRLVERGEDLRFQLGRQLSLPADLFDDERLPLGDGVPALFGGQRVPDGHLVQVAGLLLAVAGDEGHGGAPFGQRQHGLSAGQRNRGVEAGEPVGERHLRHRPSA